MIISAAGFSTLPIFTMLCYKKGLAIPSILTLRFFLATGIVWSILKLKDDLKVLKGKNLIIAFGLGSFGYATMSGLCLLALKFISTGVASIFLYTYLVFVVFISFYLLNERITNGSCLLYVAF